MIVTTLLAHLVGDYVLQWDGLACCKSRELKGVLAHGLIVLLVTAAFSLPFDMNWWPWALLIGLTHTVIDAIPLWLGKRVPLHADGTLALAHFGVRGLYACSGARWSSFMPMLCAHRVCKPSLCASRLHPLLSSARGIQMSGLTSACT
jgi:hypothetical protein